MMKEMIETPTRRDILFGRDAESWNHEGNRSFRVLVARYQDEYHACEARVKKVGIVAMIVNQLKDEGCRFLKRDNRLKLWHAVDRKACIEKVRYYDLESRSSNIPSQYSRFTNRNLLINLQVGHAIRDKQVIAQRTIEKKQQPKSVDEIKTTKVSRPIHTKKPPHPNSLSNTLVAQYMQHDRERPISMSIANEIMRQRQPPRQHLDVAAAGSLAMYRKTSQELDVVRKLVAAEEMFATIKRQQAMEQELAYLRRRSHVLSSIETGGLNQAPGLGDGRRNALMSLLTGIAPASSDLGGFGFRALRAPPAPAPVRSMSPSPRVDLRALLGLLPQNFS